MPGGPPQLKELDLPSVLSDTTNSSQLTMSPVQSPFPSLLTQEFVSTESTMVSAVASNSLSHSCVVGRKVQDISALEPSLPFIDEDCCVNADVIQPAEPLLKTSSLSEIVVLLPGNIEFKDRILPPAQHIPAPNLQYSVDYFVALSTMASSRGHSWPAGTPISVVLGFSWHIVS